MKSPQLSALKSCERFILTDLAIKEKSYLPNPTEAEQADLIAAMEVKQIVQAAIVAGEIEPDLRGEMLEALKGVVAVADRKTVEFDRARDVIRRAEK